jgi:putative CocE/NonD family hydrolase
VPTIGGAIASGAPVMAAGGYDQREDQRFFGCKTPSRPLAERDDVLVFESDILNESVEIAGAVSAQLWISSDCPDTDFTVKLVDVYPPSIDYPEGFALNLSEGIFRVRYRDGWDKQVWMEPGVVYPIIVELFDVSNLFARGHKIRVDISSSNYPHFDRNPNTGEPEGCAESYRTASNTVYMDKYRPSSIQLPVMCIF